MLASFSLKTFLSCQNNTSARIQGLGPAFWGTFLAQTGLEDIGYLP